MKTCGSGETQRRRGGRRLWLLLGVTTAVIAIVEKSPLAKS